MNRANNPSTNKLPPTSDPIRLPTVLYTERDERAEVAVPGLERLPSEPAPHLAHEM